MERYEDMENYIKIEDCMMKAIGDIEVFITRTTGIKPGQEEIADALSKYFVLKEILGFIELSRQEKK